MVPRSDAVGDGNHNPRPPNMIPFHFKIQKYCDFYILKYKKYINICSFKYKILFLRQTS